jgi:hypothetical protein
MTLSPPSTRGWGMLGPADTWPEPSAREAWVLPFVYAFCSEGVDSVNVGNVEDGFISRRVSR